MKTAKLKISLIILILLFQSSFQNGSAQITGELKWDGELKKGWYINIEDYKIIYDQVGTSGNITFAAVIVQRGNINESILLGEGDTGSYGEIEIKMLGIFISTDSVHIAVYAPRNYLFRGGPYGGPGTGLGDIPILQLTKTVSVNGEIKGDIVRVTEGENIEVVVEFKNIGTGNALNVVVTDDFPSGFAKVSGKTLYKGDIMPNNENSYNYVIKATMAGKFTLAATKATYQNAAGISNESFSKAYTIEVIGVNVTPPPVKKAIIDVKINLDKLEVVEGDEFSVKIEATNIGNATAKNVRFEGIVPDGLQISKDIDYFIPVLEERNVKKYESLLKAVRSGTYNVKINTIHDAGSENFTSDLILVRESPYAFLLKLPVYFYILPIALVVIATGWIFWRHKQYKY